MVQIPLTSVEARGDDKQGAEDKLGASEQNSATELESLHSELEQLRVELQAERKKTNDLATRMKYLQADLINMQKHEDRALAETRAQVRISWLMEIVSIKEDLDRALKLMEKSDKSSIARGLELVKSRIDGVLRAEDVQSVHAELGRDFDPSIHEAVSFQESEEHEQGKIMAVISSGYTVSGKVIKPALVEVSRKKERRHEKKASHSSDEMTIGEGASDGSSPQL
jgi:molecular chaperone GrpE